VCTLVSSSNTHDGGALPGWLLVVLSEPGTHFRVTLSYIRLTYCLTGCVNSQSAATLSSGCSLRASGAQKPGLPFSGMAVNTHALSAPVTPLAVLAAVQAVVDAVAAAQLALVPPALTAQVEQATTLFVYLVRKHGTRINCREYVNAYCAFKDSD
jgi:hypothetical protein